MQYIDSLSIALGFTPYTNRKVYLFYQFDVQKESSIKGMTTDEDLPTFNCWLMVVQLHSLALQVNL